MTSASASSVAFVLVEEEEKIRSKWRQIAFEKGLDLSIYDSPEEFLSDFDAGHFSSKHRFYLDQDFGFRRGVGIRLAKAIKQKLQAYVCLITAYPKALFGKELGSGTLDDVAGKYPSPFDCPEETEFERKYEREVWGPLLRTGLACLPPSELEFV